MTSDLTPAELSDVAAAELALGVIEGDERAAALRRVLAEPEFASAVEGWRARFAQLFDLWPEVAAPPGLGDRIERALDAQLAMVAAQPARTNRLWPGIAAFSSLIAASLLLVILLRPPAQAPAPVVAGPRAQPGLPRTLLAAAIAPVDSGAPVTAIYDRASGGLRLSQAALAGAGRSAELWVISSDGVPHSLGLLRASGTTAIMLSDANRARIAAGAVLAVSLEPIGGSPTGVPTGPVVAKGALDAV